MHAARAEPISTPPITRRVLRSRAVPCVRRTSVRPIHMRFRSFVRRNAAHRQGARRASATPCAGAVSCYLRVGVEYRVVCGRAVLTTMGWLHGVSRSADWAIRVNRDAARPTKGAVVGATPRADPQEENHIHVHHHSMHACTHLRSEVERAHWGRCCRALLPGRLIVHHQSCRQSSGAQSCRRPSDTRASLVSMFVG